MTEPYPNLHDLATAYRAGDADAGWKFVTSPRMQSLIQRMKGAWAKRSYVKEEDLEDLASDLRLKILNKIGDPLFRMPTYEDPILKESAITAYFGAYIQHLSKVSMQTIIGPNVNKTGTRADADIEFSQLGHSNRNGKTSVDFNQTTFDSMNPEKRSSIYRHTTDDLLLSTLTDPIEALDRNRKIRILSLVKTHFESDDDARIGYQALIVNSNGVDDWGEVSEIIGLGASRSHYTRMLALRFRNILKASLIETGEHVGYQVLGIYTSVIGAGVTLMSDSGSYKTWAIDDRSDMSCDALVKRLRTIFADESNVITFAALNSEDHSSAMRVAAMRALRGSEIIVEKFNIEWLESYMIEKIPNYTSAVTAQLKTRSGLDARRRSMLLAQLKRAESQILCGAA